MRSGIKEKLLYLVIPSILALLLCSHLYLVEKYGLDPWKGGGMRMYSTISSRIAGFYTTTNDTVYFVNLHSDYNTLAVKTLPTKKNMEELLRRIYSDKWYLSKTGKGVVRFSKEDDDIESPILTLKVDSILVYRIEYNLSNKVLNPVAVMSYKP